MKKVLFLNLMFLIFAAGCVENKELKKGNKSKTNIDKNTQERKINFPLALNVNGQKLFVFDPKIPAWAVYYSNGILLRTGNASGGKSYCADIDSSCKTVVGSFKVYEKRGPECISTKFPVDEGGAPMPYCMFFNGGYAIHGSNHVPNYNASHGCIRVHPEDAKWLNEEFIDIGTTVIILNYSQNNT